MTGSRRTRRAARRLVGVVLAAAATAVPVDAQIERVLLRGRVLDATTRQPLHGAVLMPEASERGTMTDSLGVFGLEVDPEPYGYVLLVEQLGYVDLQITLPYTAPEEFATIELVPNPIALDDLEVLVDRFETRRRHYFGSVRAIGQDALLRMAGSAYDVVRREVPMLTTCGTSFDHLCYYSRGRTARLQLCIDEQPAFGGALDLELLDPREIYLLEIFDRGGEIRIYTRWFVDRALERGRSLQPIEWGCS